MAAFRTLLVLGVSVLVATFGLTLMFDGEPVTGGWVTGAVLLAGAIVARVTVIDPGAGAVTIDVTDGALTGAKIAPSLLVSLSGRHPAFVIAANNLDRATP
jgi:hypothetical protein